MKIIQCATLAGLLSLALAGCATDKSAKQHPLAWGGTVAGHLKMKAVVQDVDYQAREITLKTDKNETVTFLAGPLVRNFNQITKGDKVAVDYQENVTILAAPEVEAEPVRAETVDVTGAPLGQKPAGKIVTTGEAIAEVVAVDHAGRTVTLRGPLRTLAVQVDKNAVNFDRLRIGDKVYVRYTVALIAAVTPE